jgi:dipeptidyl aminopeptidase/acylaminoacyl peptidase
MMVVAAPFDRLVGKQLADMESVSYAARDGLDIPAYLTLPPGRPAKDLPLVIMPHGGPFARDEWGYDVWAQFLASRGYVVLQPNFRGSTGFGRQFVEKGNGQWGRGMQDDIDDGVKWLVGRGLVDARRVCIMGASFGGYAAEWAAVRNPDIYRCAISFAGVSDISAQLKYDRKFLIAARYYRNWRDRVQGSDGIKLDSLSPAKRAADLKVPILIAHGDADTNVPPIQSKMLFDALTKLGRPPEYYVYKGEGHGFTKPEDQIDFLKKVAAFLAKYNPS